MPPNASGPPSEIEIGKRLVAGSEHRAPLKVVGLVQNGNPDKLFALAWKIAKHVPDDTEVFVPGSSKSIGKTRALTELAKQAGAMEPLFTVVELDEKVANRIKVGLTKAAVSQDLTENILGSGGLRVKKLLEIEKTAVRRSRRSNRFERRRSARPKMTGTILNPQLQVDGERLNINRATVVKARDPFVDDADAGLPLLSRSNALVGFMLLTDSDEVYVIPAEDMERTLNAKFLTDGQERLRSQAIRPKGVSSRRRRRRPSHPEL